ncbi:hypothetical protein J6590_033694 [Homalodisca vitripennis]|nr:hypothetical protein J6590_033694 [Homalodisca vitripennis]
MEVVDSSERDGGWADGAEIEVVYKREKRHSASVKMVLVIGRGRNQLPGLYLAAPTVQDRFWLLNAKTFVTSSWGLIIAANHLVPLHQPWKFRASNCCIVRYLRGEYTMNRATTERTAGVLILNGEQFPSRVDELRYSSSRLTVQGSGTKTEAVRKGPL